MSTATLTPATLQVLDDEAVRSTLLEPAWSTKSKNRIPETGSGRGFKP